MKKILITDMLILIIVSSVLNIAYATGNSFLDVAQNAIDEYKPNQEAESDALLDYMNQLSNEIIYSNAILDHAQNTLDKYKEDAKEEQNLMDNFPNELDKYLDSLQNSTNKNEVTDPKEETPKTDSKKEENKKEETPKKEVNEVVNTNKVENVNVENNTSNISNQTTNVTTAEKQNGSEFNLEYALYIFAGVLTIALIYIIYKIIKYSEVKK